MEATENPTFLTSLPDGQQIDSIVIPDHRYRGAEDDDDDDIDIDVKSSADSGDTPTANNEIDEILNKKETDEKTSLVIPTQATDGLADQMWD